MPKDTTLPWVYTVDKLKLCEAEKVEDVICLSVSVVQLYYFS